MSNTSSSTRKILYLIGGLVGVIILLIVIGSIAGWFGGERGVSVETTTVERRTVTQVVTASGKVQPEVEVKISPDVSGEIIELTVREGDRVERGQLLARIRPDFYTAQVEQAQANVMQSRANMAQRRADMMNAELELNRQKELFERQVVPRSALETADAQFEIAKAGFEAASYAVESAEARLREGREQLSKTAIYAPMNGTVSQLNVEAGERVVGTSQMAGTEMMRIARLNQMELEVDVNENDVVNVSLGDTARIAIDAYPERPFRGVVTEIANSARVTGAGSQEQVTNFPVKIRVLDSHNLDDDAVMTALADEGDTPLEAPNLRPGMSGTVDVYTHTVFEAIAIPIQAVTVRDVSSMREDTTVARPASTGSGTSRTEDLRRVVFIVEDGEARMIEVTTGISDDSHIVVTSGLGDGAEVVIGPYRAVSRELEDRQAVRKSDTESRRAPNGRS
jgi:HlyD family secretion protein